MTAVLNNIAAPSTHGLETLVAGDDWSLVATFYDATDAVLDLTGATIHWALLNKNFATPFVAGDFTISSGDATGEITVTVAAGSSTKVAAGLYTAYWRIALNGVSTTMLTGGVTVHADPFGATVQPATELARQIVAERMRPVINVVPLRAA